MRMIAFAALLGCGFVSCVSASYRPPVGNPDESQYTRVIDQPFDETWDALVESVAGTHFGIDNYEYASGLLTLSFGAEDPGFFVDGGHWKYKQDFLETSQNIDFEGNYVDYLSTYMRGVLVGKMNIVVRPRGPRRTAVTVNTRYVFTATRIEPGTLRVIRDTWAFSSGGSDTVAVSGATRGTPKTRTMVPTHEAEQAILVALASLNSPGPVASNAR